MRSRGSVASQRASATLGSNRASSGGSSQGRTAPPKKPRGRRSFRRSTRSVASITAAKGLMRRCDYRSTCLACQEYEAVLSLRPPVSVPRTSSVPLRLPPSPPPLLWEGAGAPDEGVGGTANCRRVLTAGVCVKIGYIGWSIIWVIHVSGHVLLCLLATHGRGERGSYAPCRLT